MVLHIEINEIAFYFVTFSFLQNLTHGYKEENFSHVITYLDNIIRIYLMFRLIEF